jgi:hypothetical protein
MKRVEVLKIFGSNQKENFEVGSNFQSENVELVPNAKAGRQLFNRPKDNQSKRCWKMRQHYLALRRVFLLFDEEKKLQHKSVL